jgi:long-chain acyl-CoA synthetase
MAIGDGRRFVSALVVPEAQAVAAWARERGIEGDLAELCTDDRVIDHFREIVAGHMEAFSRYERIREFALIPEEFSQQADELTPTLKLKRRVLVAKYADVIERMYSTGV